MSDEFVPYLKGDLDARQHRIYNLPDPQDANEVATKAYVDAGGGSQAVACVIYSSDGVQVDDIGTPHYQVWDQVYDNIDESNQLLLSRLEWGLDDNSIGTDTITATEDGIWAFSAPRLSIPFDATYGGEIIFGNMGFFNSANVTVPVLAQGGFAAGTRLFCLSFVVPMSAGDGFSVGFNAEIIATNTPLMSADSLVVAVVRLG